MLVDTHAHIHFSAFREDLDDVIKRARAARVFMIAVGTQKDTSANAVKVAEEHPDLIWASIGLHPNHLFAMHFDETEMPVKTRTEEFDAYYYATLAKSSKRMIAIGECGLDYYRLPQDVPRELVIEKQKQVFKKHLDLADELGLPVIVHCRDAHDDVYEILKEYCEKGKLKKRGVLHCFTAGRREAFRYIDLGFYIALGGVITFKSRRPEHLELLETARAIPLERVVIETDAPYLTPDPFRGKRNEPLYVKFVAEKLADLRSMTYDEIASATTQNAKKLFGLEYGI